MSSGTEQPGGSSTYYRFRDASGTTIVVRTLEEVPARYRGDAEAFVVQAGPSQDGTRGDRAVPDDASLRVAAEAVLDALQSSGGRRFDGASFGFGVAVGVAVVLALSLMRRTGRWMTRLAMLAVVLAVMGSSVLGLYLAPHLPGAPEWLMTPDELVREAKRVAAEADPRRRLGELR